MAEIVPNRVPCGKRPTPPQPPKPEPTPGTLCDLTGVKYFKLQSDIPGDYTKNCGLLGNEIDENFYFLRSMDIKTAYTIDEEGRKILVLERIHCNRDIKVDITDARDYKFRLEDGYLIITHPGGYEEKVGKFLVEGDDVHVVTDSSIQGDGSCERPLGVDLAYRTGTYAPADFYVDFTCGDRKLEDYEDIGYSHAIVTKELASRFGALYTYGQVKAIAEDLGKKDCHWRVPSVEDWGKLLNAAEPNEKSRNHNTDMTGNFGCVAGNRLKAMEFWDVEEPAQDPIDDLGLTIYPVGVCPEVYNTKDPDEYGFMGLYGVTSFWESGETNGQAYVRTFSYGHDDVAQFLESKASRRSVRLVMDVDDDFDIPEYALILDNYVEVVYVPEAKQLWTKYNIGFKNYVGYDEKQVTVPVEWAEVEDSGATMNLITETKYYYNAWDGRAWHKKMMKEGESVVLLYEDPEEPCDTASTAYVTSANTNHEWRVFFNEETQLDELIDTLEALKKEFQKEFDEINEKIDDLSAATESEIARLDDRIDDLQITSAETPDDTILASYVLREGVDGEQKGVRIDIPKDKSIKSIKLGHSGATVDENTGEITDGPEENHEVLLIVYHNAEGKYELVEVDLEDFIIENEFKDGLEVDDHDVKVKIDPDSDWFLTVSMSGVSLQGVDAAFDNVEKDIIGAEGDTKSGYSIDLFDAVWTEVTKEECEEQPHEIVNELPDPKEWTGTTYIEVFVAPNQHTYYKREPSTNYISDSENLVEAIKALDEALKEESDRAKEAEQALDEKIDAETERAMSAETALHEEIVAETERAMSAETKLHEEIVAETERAIAAEEDLQNQINEEASARTAADEDLQNQINEEVSARTAADEDLQNQIDEEVSARTAADEYLQEQIDELNAKTIEPLDESIVVEVSGNVTSIGVVIDSEDEHLKLGENGLWIDGDYGEFQG